MRSFIPRSILYKALTASSTLRSLGFGADQLALAAWYLRERLTGERPDRERLDEAMAWLCRAHDASEGKGVSCVYDLKTGWGVAYPETSGYIIATFLAYADLTGDLSYVERAKRIADWEIAIQTPGGGVLSNPLHTYTRVFNTGQVILGWCALYERTRNDAYLQAACRAGDYLAGIQEQDGTWVKDTYCGARTYHARVDWSLLRLACLSGRELYADTAFRNLQWVLQQQRPNGWFANCGFNSDDPIMHVIVYTLRGLLESHIHGGTGSERLDILGAVTKAADELCAAVERHPVKGIAGMVPTSFGATWESSDAHSCLTGNAQFACFLFRLARASGTARYRDMAEMVLHATSLTQLIDTPFPQIRGAIAGSYPVSQGYHPNSYPNWATKFLADAFMMKLGYEQGKTVPG